MSSMSMCESQIRKTLTTLLQHALPSSSFSSNNNTTTNSNNLPWLHLQRHPLLPDFPPSPASALPPPRPVLSSLLPREERGLNDILNINVLRFVSSFWVFQKHPLDLFEEWDVWNGRAFSLKRLYFNTWPDVSFSTKPSEFTGHEGGMGGSSASRGSRIQSRWTNILIASNLLAYGAHIATRGQLMSWGAQINTLIAQGQLWRLVTSSFLHAHIPHLLLNCYALYSLGNSVETTSGPGRFLAVYFTSAVASSAMSYRFTKGTSVGASGAIAGLVGAYAVYLMRHKDLMEDTATKGLERIAHIIVLNMLIGYYFKSIDNWGHLGGLLGGAVASWFLGPAFKLETSPKDGRRVYFDRAPIFNILGLGRRER